MVHQRSVNESVQKFLFELIRSGLNERIFVMKKRVSFFLALLLVFMNFSTVIFASEEIIENGDFESDILLWQSGSFCETEPHSGLRCLSFSSPQYSEQGTILHNISYLSTFPLVANTVYSLKFYIRTNMPDNLQFIPEGTMSLSTDSGSFTMHVAHVTEDWQPVAVCFTSDNTGTYSFSLSIEHSFENAVFYMDDIIISPIDFTPVSLDIQGKRSITIPEAGESTFTYTSVVTDGLGNYVSNRNADISAVTPLPNGVSFDDEKNTLYVNADAPENSSVILVCNPVNDTASLTPATITIFLSKNLISNGDFDDIPLYSGWEQNLNTYRLVESKKQNLCAEVTLSDKGEDLYSATLSPTPSFLLYPDNLYVFRASVRAESLHNHGQPEAQVISSGEENIYKVLISNVNQNNWTDVFAAFRVPAYGIYTIEFEFTNSFPSTVYIDNIKLQPETPVPSGILLNLPQHIVIQEDELTELPFKYIVYDQEGFFCDSKVYFEVAPLNAGVTVSADKIIIQPDAVSQTYTLSASLLDAPSIQTIHKVNINKESVADGGFENTVPGQCWATASPSLLQFVSEYEGISPADGSQMACLTMNGTVSALLSDSVCRYNATQSYVFEVDMKTIFPNTDTIVTVLIDNNASESFDDNLVVGQFSISDSMQHIQKLFTPSTSVTGRIMVAFNTTDSQQVVLIDNVRVSKANVTANNVTISGLPYLDRNIVGKYRFSSNFSATNSSTYRWLFSNELNGIYMPIDGRTDSVLSITADMIGKYVKFEVTPISLSGPVVGEIVTSQPILIGEPISTDSATSSTPFDEIKEFPEKENGESLQTPENGAMRPETSVSIGGMRVLDIRKFTPANTGVFWDLEKHWAKKEIELLNAAGVVRGRGNGLFEPDVYITRAEFTAFLAPGFELAPIYYEGQFTDVKSYNWYAGAIAVVTKHGIAQGTSKNTFSPELPITREEMAAMIMRAYRKTGAQTNGSDLAFSDVSDVSEWAMNDVGEAKALGLISGLPDGSFQPKRNATRAEAAVIIKRMLTILVS